jgi:hypothetical protein
MIDLAAVPVGQHTEDDGAGQLGGVEAAGEERQHPGPGAPLCRVRSSTRKMSIPPVTAVLTRSTNVARSIETMERFIGR